MTLIKLSLFYVNIDSLQEIDHIVQLGNLNNI
jgi:hypothetical protein